MTSVKLVLFRIQTAKRNGKAIYLYTTSTMLFESILFSAVVAQSVVGLVRQLGTKSQYQSLAMVSVDLAPREYRDLLPLPCIGTYKTIGRREISALFLGPDQMVCDDKGGGKCLARGLVPIPIQSDGSNVAFLTAMQASIYTSNRGCSSQLLTDRTGGFYDNLKNVAFPWAVGSRAQYTSRAVYDCLRSKSSSLSPFHGIASAIDAHADLKICGLLVELADVRNDQDITLGGAVLLVKVQYVHNWQLNYKRCAAIMKAARASAEAQLVKCTLDEVVGLAFATQLPVIMSNKLYAAVSVDGILTKDPVSGSIDLVAPYGEATFDAPRTSATTRRSGSSTKADTTAAPRAQDIPDAATFLSMHTSEKRAVLRATGVQGVAMPRPREGRRAVDAVLIPLLDEEVRFVLYTFCVRTQNFITKTA